MKKGGYLSSLVLLALTETAVHNQWYNWPLLTHSRSFEGHAHINWTGNVIVLSIHFPHVNTHTHTHTLSLSLSLSLTHTHTHTHTELTKLEPTGTNYILGNKPFNLLLSLPFLWGLPRWLGTRRFHHRPESCEHQPPWSQCSARHTVCQSVQRNFPLGSVRLCTHTVYY